MNVLTQTPIEPSAQNLPFEGWSAPEDHRGTRRRRIESELSKAWRMYVLGGLGCVAIGSIATYVYQVSIDDAAAAGIAWLSVAYVLGRVAVQAINALVEQSQTPPEPDGRPSLTMMIVAGGMLAGTVCMFLAATIAASAGVYALIPLTWAIHPALVLCSALVSTAFALIVGSLLFAVFCAKALPILTRLVEY
ncbi:MAG TPA: hypothetical protein VFA27_09400, partial [Vicinamibacterales bacterium]|nr:hypothetical protein [Vicinamibacterales bacterium]